MNILKYKWFLVSIVICVIFVAYGQTLQMYFWQDDSALIFKLQHPEGAAGSWGVGLFERGPYRYAVAIFLPFFKLFGLEPFWYFATGLLIYILTAAVFYLFAYQLLQNKKVAYFCTLVFSAGFVGSDSMFRIANSWHNNIGVIFAILTLWVYTRFLQSNRIRDYLLSIGVFWLTIELIFIRSHSLIFPILGLDLLFRMLPFKISKLPGLILRQVPFWILFKLWYLQGSASSASGVDGLLKDIVVNKEIVKLSSLFADTGNNLIPNIIQTRIISLLSEFLNNLQVVSSQVTKIHLLIYFVSLLLIILLRRYFTASNKLTFIICGLITIATFLNIFFYQQHVLWYRDIQDVTAGLIGLYSWIFVPFFAALNWKKQKILARAMVLGLFIITSQIFGYYIKYPEAIFSTTHRYFTYSFIGYSLLWGVIIYYLKEVFLDKWCSKGWLRIIGYTPLFLFLFINLFLGFSYQKEIVNERSLPSRKFYYDLTKMVSQVNKGAIFYFDVDKDSFYRRQFDDFFSVGSMPNSTALAIYYGIDRDDIALIENFDELAFKISNNLSGIGNLYTFSYGQEGLINTTNNTRSLLKSGSDFINISQGNLEFKTKQDINKDGVVGQPLKIPLNMQGVNLLTPLIIELNLKINFLAFPAAFPYMQQGPTDKDLSLSNKTALLNCLSEVRSYYQLAKVSSLSDWKYREIRNVKDSDYETAWQGGRIWWHDNKEEDLVVDLGAIKQVNNIIWRNWRPELSPTSYVIQTSMDGNEWKDVKIIQNGPERKGDEVVKETFMLQSTRFIRMKIIETLGDDSPALEEFLVLGPKCAEINLQQANDFLENPFGYVKDKEEWENIYKGLADMGKMKLEWSNKQINNQTMAVGFPLNFDNQFHVYQIVIPPNSWGLANLNLVLNIPAEVLIREIKARNLSITEMNALGLVKSF